MKKSSQNSLALVDSRKSSEGLTLRQPRLIPASAALGRNQLEGFGCRALLAVGSQLSSHVRACESSVTSPQSVHFAKKLRRKNLSAHPHNQTQTSFSICSSRIASS